MIHGFGDESIDSEIVAYAAAVFSADRTPEAEVILATAKKSVGLSPEVPLHCREVFSGDARKRSPWANIKAANIYAMIEDVCQKLKGIQHQPVVSVIESRRVPAQPVAPDQPNRPLVEKGIATMAYQAVATALILRFGESGIRLWIDPDSTKIPWGKEHKQVNTTRSFYLDLKPGNEPSLLNPEIENSPKPKLLEVADIYAYVARRAFSKAGGWQFQWCRDLYGVIQPQECIFEFNPNSQWVKAS
jgi:hypothetical protein